MPPWAFWKAAQVWYPCFVASPSPEKSPDSDTETPTVIGLDLSPTPLWLPEPEPLLQAAVASIATAAAPPNLTARPRRVL